MQIILDRGGALWWMAQRPDVSRWVLRYGIRQPVWSYLATFGCITKLADGDCVPCTDDGGALLYKAQWGPLPQHTRYTQTETAARDILLHKVWCYMDYLQLPTFGMRPSYYMIPFETSSYTWERV